MTGADVFLAASLTMVALVALLGLAIRFLRLRRQIVAAICRELDCQPGDLLAYRPGAEPSPA